MKSREIVPDRIEGEGMTVIPSFCEKAFVNLVNPSWEDSTP
jgi:hypothetical protein